MADFFKTNISTTSLDDFLWPPQFLVFRSAPESSWQGVLKQAIDFVGALLMLLVAGP